MRAGWYPFGTNSVVQFFGSVAIAYKLGWVVRQMRTFFSSIFAVFELFVVVVVVVFGNSIEFSYRANCIRTHVSENAMRTLATCNLHIFCSFVRKRSVHLLFRKFFFRFVTNYLCRFRFAFSAFRGMRSLRFFFNSSTGDN